MITRISCALGLVSMFIFGCDSACQNPINWDNLAVLPEEDYDKNSTSLRQGMRPLGFYYTVLPYTPDGNPNPCFSISGTSGKRVEIMSETHGAMNARMCVRTNIRDLGCGDTSLYSCDQADTNNLQVEFYCDANSCEQSDIGIWVRMVVSFNEYDADPELFCFGRNTGQFPSTLIQVPDPPTVEPIHTTKGAGSTVTVTSMLLAISTLISTLL